MFIGIGLSDIASAGFIYFAALMIAVGAPARRGAARDRDRRRRARRDRFLHAAQQPADGARACRAFALSLTAPSRGMVAVRGLVAAGVVDRAVRRRRRRSRSALLLFACAHLSLHRRVFVAAWHDVAQSRAVASRASRSRRLSPAMCSSLMMVLTFNDPPRFALVCAAVAVRRARRGRRAAAGVKVFRDVPLALVAFFLVACSAALAARGVAYAGRFSVHLLGAGCALTVCAIASAVIQRRRIFSIFRSRSCVMRSTSRR